MNLNEDLVKHMATVNNFDIFRKIIDNNPPTSDEYYFIQILKRKKDGHSVSGHNVNRCVKYYNIKSVDEFDRVKDEIISICEALNTRAYIYYSKKSFEKTAKLILQRTTECFVSENYIGLKSVHQACCSECIANEKTYLIDVDTKDLAVLNIIKDYINMNCEPMVGNKVVDLIPSKSGYHIITVPFDVDNFKNWFFEPIDVHKNSPTILYVK